MISILAAALLVLAQDTLKTDKGDLVLTPIEHATFVMKCAGKTIFVDPTKGGDAFKEFGKPDLILVTDIHGDHYDQKTLSAVRTAEAVVIVPAAVAEKMGAEKGNAKVLANGEKTKVGDIEVEAVGAYDIKPGEPSHPKGKSNGYVVTLGGKRIYISGDTEDIPEMRALKDIDAAFVCMNLPYTMDVDKAADAVLAFKPKIVYPYHYRGKPAMSDVEKFKSIVAKDKGIEVRLLKWYK